MKILDKYQIDTVIYDEVEKFRNPPNNTKKS